MDEQMLSKVLDLLDADPQQAAAEYRKLHERLARFFEWNNARDPHALADEAIDRLGKRVIDSNEDKGVRRVSAFALGIARHLLQEEARKQSKDAEAGRLWTSTRQIAPSPQADQAELMDEALRQSLDRMQPDRRRLILSYYLHQGRLKAKAHQQLAEEFGLSINALRNRALRARKDLEAAIRAYLESETR